MITTKTPFRISFFGGGTDIPAWFKEEGGQVLSTSIDKYCYVTVRDLPPFFDHSIRLAYSRLETVSEFDEIQHPLIREILRDFDYKNIEIHYDADLPGNSGLGSSSSFGVGLISALAGMKGRLLSNRELASKVIHFEREVLQEHGGYQDQIAASYGGLNHIVFHKDDTFSVNPVVITNEKLIRFKQSLCLYYIPVKRYSSDVSLAKNYSKDSHEENLRYIHDSVNDALHIIQNGDINDLGSLMNETWQRKRQFGGVTTEVIDEIYNTGIKAGALGGKLLGAGGGGFMLFFCPPEKQKDLSNSLEQLLCVPFDLDQDGTKVIYFRNSW